MSITDELRKYADTLSECVRCGATIPSPFNPHSGAPIGPMRETEELYAIADRIDAEYQKAEDEWKAKGGQSWLNGYEECRVELMEGNEVVAASLEEAGWIRLPKDANGEVIHVGDVMELMERCGKVVALQLSDNPWGDGNHWAIQLEGENAPTVLDRFFHHHEPTVEDVLREFGDWYAHTKGGCDEDGIIAEYAAKLQLRGDRE